MIVLIILSIKIFGYRLKQYWPEFIFRYLLCNIIHSLAMRIAGAIIVAYVFRLLFIRRNAYNKQSPFGTKVKHFPLWLESFSERLMSKEDDRATVIHSPISHFLFLGIDERRYQHPVIEDVGMP